MYLFLGLGDRLVSKVVSVFVERPTFVFDKATTFYARPHFYQKVVKVPKLLRKSGFRVFTENIVVRRRLICGPKIKKTFDLDGN